MFEVPSSHALKTKMRLLLHCDAAQSTYCLAKEGGDTREYFTVLRDALDSAAATVREDTRITISNELGKAVWTA